MTARDAPPDSAVRPADLAAVRDVMLDTSGPLLFAGGGTKLAWGVPPVDGGTVVSSIAETRRPTASPGGVGLTFREISGQALR